LSIPIARRGARSSAKPEAGFRNLKAMQTIAAMKPWNGVAECAYAAPISRERSLVGDVSLATPP